MEIILTRGKVAVVEAIDYEFISQFKWFAFPAHNTWYACKAGPRSGGKRLLFMHRVIMGAKDGQMIDHIDRDGLNNCRGNLRFCTRAQNLHNQGKHKTNTSGFKGITWHNGKWQTSIRNDGANIYVGRYDDPTDAAKAYDEAARRLHGEFAVTNFPVTQ